MIIRHIKLFVFYELSNFLIAKFISIYNSNIKFLEQRQHSGSG